MKNKLLLFFTLLLLLGFGGCTTDDESLPPETQTGAGTFGCTVDGKNFVDNSGNFNCYYQYIDGEYYFGISGRRESGNPRHIRINIRNLEITEGLTLQFLDDNDGAARGGADFIHSNNINSEEGHTSEEYTGQLTITRFDIINRIVSGNFYFDVKNPYNGKTVKIRDGRFDSRFGM